MNNRIIAGIVVVIVIIAAVFLVTRNKGAKTEVASNTEATSQASSASTESGSIKSLIAAGKSQKCTYSVQGDSGAASEGTIYVGDGKMRGDFTASSMSGQTHMINMGDTTYMWSDDGKMAIKMAFDPNAAVANANTGAQTSQSASIEENHDFKCEGWSVDGSKFELPSGVNFTELPNMSAGAAANAGAGLSGSSAADQQKAIRTQVCNSLSGIEKEQCLSTIK